MGVNVDPPHDAFTTNLWSKIAMRVNDYGWKATMSGVGKARGRKGRITKKRGRTNLFPFHFLLFPPEDS